MREAHAVPNIALVGMRVRKRIQKTQRLSYARIIDILLITLKNSW